MATGDGSHLADIDVAAGDSSHLADIDVVASWACNGICIMTWSLPGMTRDQIGLLNACSVSVVSFSLKSRFVQAPPCGAPCTDSHHARTLVVPSITLVVLSHHLVF